MQRYARETVEKKITRESYELFKFVGGTLIRIRSPAKLERVYIFGEGNRVS